MPPRNAKRKETMTQVTPIMPSRNASAALVLAAALALASCAGGDEAATPGSRNPVDVVVQAASLETGPQLFDVGGQVRARATATMVSKLFAEIQEILVQPGDKVRAGQVLVRLDSRDLQAQRAQAEAGAAAAEQAIRAATTNRDAAEAGLALATATHKRIADLRAKNSATPNELDQAVSGLKAAESHVAGAQAGIRQAEAAAEAARAALRAATVGASYAVITAPFDGIVTEKRIEAGNMATPGAPLMTVEGAGAFRLEVRVDESRIGDIDRSKPVDVFVDSIGQPGSPTARAGTISEVSRDLDGAHAFLVKVDLPADGDLRSGMFGRARFEGGSRQALTVPASAIVRRGQLTSVFVVDKDNRARLRLVQVANTQGSRAEIAAGLDSGEQVVVQPSATLVDGAPVRPAGRSASGAVSAAAVREVRR
jgi:RND family efflux transporter MFP subunit